ncbi:hypothetical protein E2C01_102264 [Portunus trituberculatus]|uniref:Uncharacterized protein n=1 Tax=Portunus trituberculatus TaxID=210409 RepID=A0A5B7KGV7_PORTR|nr:hypothetical protein [Portunus trituberculatus]
MGVFMSGMRRCHIFGGTDVRREKIDFSRADNTTQVAGSNFPLGTRNAASLPPAPPLTPTPRTPTTAR